VRLHEKGGKFHEMPCHHTLEGYLAEYMDRARLTEAGRVPLFQAFKHRPYGRGQAQLTGERLDRINAWKMVRRRAKAAGITTEVCNHTFAAPASRPTSRTVAHSRRRARWRRMPPPAPPNSTTGARIASRLMKW
jgi:hypothetical protein